MNMQKILVISVCILAVLIICNVISSLDLVSSFIGGIVGYFLGKYIENDSKKDRHDMDIL